MKTNRWTLNIAVFALLLGPCDESLPPYTEPDVFLKGEVSALYVARAPFGNRLILFLRVMNVYEETLDDVVQLSGTLEMKSVRMPEVTKTFDIGSAQLQTGPGYNRQTGQLIFDPGDTLVFSVSWDFSTDDRGVDPRKDFFIFYRDTSCDDRCFAQREEFILTGEVRIFDERAPVRASVLLPVCYISAIACETIITDPPCVHVPQPSQTRCYPFGGGGN